MGLVRVQLPATVQVRDKVRIPLTLHRAREIMKFLDLWQTALGYPIEVTSFYRPNHPGHRSGSSVDVILRDPTTEMQRRAALRSPRVVMRPYYQRRDMWRRVRDSLEQIGADALALGILRVALEADHFHVDHQDAFGDKPALQRKNAEMAVAIGRPILARWSPGVNNMLVHAAPVMPRLRQETDLLATIY